MPMIGLFLDTATHYGYVGVMDEKGRVIADRLLTESRLHADFLGSRVNELFDELSMQAQQLDFAAVGLGPGSYTGLRIAIAFAQGLHLATELPLCGFSSLVGYVPEQFGSYAALLDARGGGVYGQLGCYEKESISYTTDPFVVPIEEAALQLKGVDWIVSPDGERLQHRFPDVCKEKWVPCAPNLQVVASTALACYKENRGGCRSLTPLYLRSP